MAKSARKKTPKKSSGKASKAPWSKSNPRKRAGKASKHLTGSQKSAAKARAKRAGRPYPNLVDNMRMASKTKAKKAGKKKAKKASGKSASKKRTTRTRTSARKSARKAKKKKSVAAKSSRDKDPRGGLTAAGRRSFARKQGSHLRPGVTKKEADMTPTEMRRKGSWAVRFYGRSQLPPLVDKDGAPTRHALSAHAWGEPVPKTVAAARRIAKKGQRLLDRYHRLKTR